MSRLDSPPPGVRCPACWHDLSVPEGLRRLDPFDIAICTRCFALVVGLGLARCRRAGWHEVSPHLVKYVHVRHFRMIVEAASRWRASRFRRAHP